ncbi:MAG: type VI secretion system baseplate subunit TssK [Burkholderiaceae bacterium]|nr:type VI secretion system baseplate subunit TssK [Burkholderiaceae bacterium]
MDSRKVVWAEGMFLRPQHFQQQERYLEFFAHARAMAGESYFWGLRELEIDVEALALGKLVLNKAVGIFPDGTPFSLPGTDALPAPLEVAPTAKDERVFLAFPMRRIGAAEVRFDERETLARYEAADAELNDCNSEGAEPAPAQLAQMRVQLLPESKLTDSWLRMAVAHVVERRSDGTVVLDARHIPPSITYGQSPVLHAMVNDIAGLMQQRGEALAARVTQPGRGGISEVGDFMMLNIINRWQPLMTHLRDHRVLHPERVYGHLLELAGELSSFTRENRRPVAYPVYDHDDPRPSFEAVVADIRRSLSMVLEQNAIAIELHERQYGVRVGVIPDHALLRNATFVLAVFAELPAEIIRSRFPTQVKIGPVEKIRDLVNLHLPGVRALPMPIAPRQLPYHANYNYFELDTNHELWGQLERSGGMALHLAGDFPGLRIECWAIRN